MIKKIVKIVLIISAIASFVFMVVNIANPNVKINYKKNSQYIRNSQGRFEEVHYDNYIGTYNLREDSFEGVIKIDGRVYFEGVVATEGDLTGSMRDAQKYAGRVRISKIAASGILGGIFLILLIFVRTIPEKSFSLRGFSRGGKGSAINKYLKNVNWSGDTVKFAALKEINIADVSVFADGEEYKADETEITGEHIIGGVEAAGTKNYKGSFRKVNLKQNSIVACKCGIGETLPEKICIYLENGEILEKNL